MPQCKYNRIKKQKIVCYMHAIYHYIIKLKQQTYCNYYKSKSKFYTLWLATWLLNLMERFALATLGKVRDLAGGFSTDSGKHRLLVNLELFFIIS